ncbi:MAG: AmmeMemoRadiSam system protein A [Clostridiales bacterium]|nr:AmmeMemoRadiSam system protein A [Clostridiales bacterium]
MGILSAIMVPHPPLILPPVGRGEEQKIQATIDAYRQAARSIFEARPGTIILITPHSAIYADWFHISPGPSAKGNFAQFGAGSLKVEARYDETFVAELCAMAREVHLPAGTQGQQDAALDHATMIPLHFLREAFGTRPLPPIVRVGLAGLPLSEHYRLGMLIRDTAGKLARRVCVVASGDLSHRLKADGPYGFRPEGPQYDERIMDVMGRAAFGELLDFSDTFCEAAGECGHRSFSILAGCFDGVAVDAKALSYEGPFGVGYGVCVFTAGHKDDSRRYLDAALAKQAQRLKEHVENEDAYVRLARLTVETYVTRGHPPKLPEGLPDDMTGRRAGVFVSLHKDGQLRGCIGTTSATTPSVAEEILQNAVGACARDPRFDPLTTQELPLLEYSVDVLGAAEPIASPEQLDVKRYGVIVSSGRRLGLLLPDLDGVDTVEEQIAIAKRKAGIRPNEKVDLQRFEVVRHG